MTSSGLSSPNSANVAAAGGGKYLNFHLGDEAYSLPILQVREIIRLSPVTPVPRMPAFVKGVINLRGKIVPVMDLRERLNRYLVEYDERACIVVIQASSAGHFGVIVDSVDDVSNIPQEDIDPPPEFGFELNTEFIMGVAKTKTEVKIILDIHRVLNVDPAIRSPDLGLN
jgi:purine-binding chemotaxis protein CheW